ncbi:protein FAR1-RELATED SEQUENCE 5-like [Silene latifolia]|uniref:protein FAR1-RELATED SEQUENCE 5-like n=1 Tax=Silene latifolia TaxID=37657 RepID=UPI003D78713E
MCSSYFFDFDVDDHGRLSRVCWFNPIAIKNYSLKGDMTSFDTTFNMNTYKMIFAPFTGVDHHKKCVTFGAGLIRKETDEDFVWLFQNFLSAMSNKYPVCIITDQDRGIRSGVKTVFGDKTQHRYCMWHIMKKLPDKIGTTLYRETNFMKELCSCVWAEDIEPSEFEERWCSVISSYELTDNEWLNTMFDKRAYWIGVTTSDSIPIIDREKDKVYYVNFISDEMKVNCTCKKFERHGILCRHALYVLKEQGLDNVPDQYLLSRWSKLATCQPICNNVPHTLIEDCNSLDVRRHKIGFKDKISAQTSTSECSSSSSNTGDRLRKKNRELEMLLGTKIPKEVVVLPPIQSKNKRVWKKNDVPKVKSYNRTEESGKEMECLRRIRIP